MIREVWIKKEISIEIMIIIIKEMLEIVGILVNNNGYRDNGGNFTVNGSICNGRRGGVRDRNSLLPV